MNYNKKTISDVELAGKKVLVRCDFNVPMNSDGTIESDRRIVETLEADEYALRARRIEIPASITGLEFYRRLGYTFKNGNEKVDEEGLYRLEKLRQ